MITSLQLSMPSPSWYTGRLWILRLGYYKLTRPKEQGDDWVWIVDHTVQIGAEKCLVILGVRLSALPAMGECLSHKDVEPIALWPVKKSNGEVVYQQLEAGIEKTGIPREIVSDHGTDLKLGIDQFCQAHRWYTKSCVKLGSQVSSWVSRQNTIRRRPWLLQTMILDKTNLVKPHFKNYFKKS
jgi:hypothetical protein